MSGIEGLEELRRKLKSFDEQVALAMNDHVIAETRKFQEEVASSVPVDTGEGRDALLDESAFRITKSPDGPGIRIIYGLDVPALAKRAFHLFFVEFGTKGYTKGDMRKAGKKKLTGANWKFVSVHTKRDGARFDYRESVGADGQPRLEARLKDPQRWQRMKTDVPARPANPFWRPAEANLWRRLQAKLDMTRIVEAAKRAAGFADQS
jgi:hypothetical protein